MTNTKDLLMTVAQFKKTWTQVEAYAKVVKGLSEDQQLVVTVRYALGAKYVVYVRLA